MQRGAQALEKSKEAVNVHNICYVVSFHFCPVCLLQQGMKLPVAMTRPAWKQCWQPWPHGQGKEGLKRLEPLQNRKGRVQLAAGQQPCYLCPCCPL